MPDYVSGSDFNDNVDTVVSNNVTDFTDEHNVHNGNAEEVIQLQE